MRGVRVGVIGGVLTACLSCGDRTGLFAGAAGASFDGAAPVASIDASQPVSFDASLDARRPVDATPGTEAGHDAAVRDASLGDAACGGQIETRACQYDTVCCSVAFEERCPDHTYSGGALCPTSTTQAGMATFTGGCFVDGKQVGSFTFAASCSECLNDIDGLVAEAEAQCGFPR
jgi:hypothetical protein